MAIVFNLCAKQPKLQHPITMRSGIGERGKGAHTEVRSNKGQVTNEIYIHLRVVKFID